MKFFLNGKIPRYFLVLPEGRQAIIQYCKDYLKHGYRYLTYVMRDENVAVVSPSTTYRILKQAGLLRRWKGLMNCAIRLVTGYASPFGGNRFRT